MSRSIPVVLGFYVIICTVPFRPVDPPHTLHLLNLAEYLKMLTSRFIRPAESVVPTMYISSANLIAPLKLATPPLLVETPSVCH